MKPLIILFILLGIACNTPTDKRNNIDELTKVTLPYSGSCKTNLTIYEKDNISAVIQKLPDNLMFAGLLKHTEKYSAIILVDTHADYQIPYLTTINNQGEIIEKFDLYSIGCAEDESSWGQANFLIDKDLKIIQTDSSASYKRNENGEIIKETINGTSHKLEFYIDKNGKIKKHSNH